MVMLYEAFELSKFLLWPSEARAAEERRAYPMMFAGVSDRSKPNPRRFIVPFPLSHHQQGTEPSSYCFFSGCVTSIVS